MAELGKEISKILSSDGIEHYINAKYWNGHQWEGYRLEYKSGISLSNLNPCNEDVMSHEYDEETGKGVFIYDNPPTSIVYQAFWAMDITSVTIPDSVINIGDKAFAGCYSLTSVTIPDSVTEIGDYAFFACECLENVTIGNGVTVIGEDAFNECVMLQNVFMRSKSVPSLYDNNVFGYWGSVSNLKIWVPIESLMEYVNDSVWASYVMNIKGYIPSGENILSGVNLSTINNHPLIGPYNYKFVEKDEDDFINESLIPRRKETGYSYDLGSSDYKWDSVYSTQFLGDLNGSASKVRLTGGTTTGSEPMLYLVGATEQGAPARVQKKVELNTLGMLSGNVPRWGVAYESASSSLIIGDLSKDSEGQGSSYLTLGSNKIYGNNMSEGVYIDTNGGDWSLGTLTEGNDECNISGSGSTMSLKSKDITITGKEGVTITDDGNLADITLSSYSGVNIVVGDDGGSQGKINITSDAVRVEGVFYCSSDMFRVDTSGECYAISFYETSDENLKDFHDDITVDFNKLKEIRKSYFTWKDGDQNLHIGTSAQDIQKVYPELVSEDNKGNLTVDYAKLSIIALSAIDKLDERLSRIENILNKEE